MTMDPPKLLMKWLLIASILLYSHGVRVQSVDSQLPYHEDEKNALLELRASLNNSFLNNNWTFVPCNYSQSMWYGIRCKDGRVSSIVLEGLELDGYIILDTFAFEGLSVLNFKNNAITGNIMTFAGNQKLAHVDLSGNKFQGPIPGSLLSLTSLESLQLQNNNLIGEIPAFNQSTLASFNVSNNNLSGSVPSTKFLQSLGTESFLGNPGLCGPPTLKSCSASSTSQVGAVNGPSPSESPSPSGKKAKTPSFGILFLIFNMIAFLAVLMLYIVYQKKASKLERLMKKDKAASESEFESEYICEAAKEEEENGSGVAEEGEKSQAGAVESQTARGGGGRGGGGGGAERERGKLVFMESSSKNGDGKSSGGGGGFGFELSDLLKSSAEGLGKGIFGNTYKAVLSSGQALVVKRMRDLKPMTSEEFTKQLRSLADHEHPNLLPPLAYFFSKQEKLLVYRYAEKGNLFNRIHEGRGGKDRVPFRWSARLSAAQGVARALNHLHLNADTNVAIPHGNLKTTNVLLDQNNVVLVSDYGLASLVALPVAAHSMVAYKSPEYQFTRRLSRKADVWSYGCLLLELLTGRICAASAPPGSKGVDLCGWVHRAVREEWTNEIFDVEISARRNASNGMLRLLQVAIRCCDKSPEKRLEMAEIVREIESVKVVAESEDEEDASMDRSLTDDYESLSTASSAATGD